MKITEIDVYGLFERFDHHIHLNPDERVTIMIGPNGFGKTMILRIMDALFNLRLQVLKDMPFKELQVFFDNYSNIRIRRISSEDAGLAWTEEHILEFYYSVHNEPKGSYSLAPQLMPGNMHMLRNIVADIIPSLRRVGHSEWVDTDTDQILDFHDVISEYEEFLPSARLKGSDSEIPSWLAEIEEAVPVRFIGTERLTPSDSDRNRKDVHRHRHPRRSAQRTVRRYSSQLAAMVQQKLTEYGTLSQSLDRTFPARLMNPINPAPGIVTLLNQLASVEQKTSDIVEAGLLIEEHDELPVLPLKAVDESRIDVLAVYAQDALRKLSVFDDLYTRVEALKRIINKRFLYKKVNVGQQGLKVEALDGTDLDLEMLSSGEQHELVLLYDLLFGISPNSLIMIDEPELSLHVAWQRQLLSDLQEMANLSDFHVLLATHSPQIIGDRWDLASILEGPEDE